MGNETTMAVPMGDDALEIFGGCRHGVFILMPCDVANAMGTLLMRKTAIKAGRPIRLVGVTDGDYSAFKAGAIYREDGTILDKNGMPLVIGPPKT